MKYNWLLFDADDTLFDFPQAEANALRWTFEQIGLPYQPAYTEAYHHVNQVVWKQFERGELTSLELRTKRFELLFNELHFTADPEQVSPVYLRNLALGSDLLYGAEEVVRTLSGSFRLALVTNGLSDVQRPRLARSVLKDAFEHVFISDELGVAKPNAAFFDIVFEGIGNPPKAETIIIGDSLTSDMGGGINYGIDTCWYNPNGKITDLPVTYQVKNLLKIPKLLA